MSAIRFIFAKCICKTLQVYQKRQSPASLFMHFASVIYLPSGKVTLNNFQQAQRFRTTSNNPSRQLTVQSHIYTYINTYIYIHIYTFTYIHIYTYIYTHIYIYIYIYIYILHEQIGFQCFILVLNATKVVTFFISCGMEFQILGLRYDINCLPYISGST